MRKDDKTEKYTLYSVHAFIAAYYRPKKGVLKN
jgi:hypothetical protein